MKAAIIGGSSGIGAATARVMAGRGWEVRAAGTRPDPEPLGPGTQYVQVDVRDAEAIAAFLVDVPDVLVYSAGLNAPEREMRALSWDDWRSILDVNVNGAFHALKAVLPAWRARGGGLAVFVSSVSALSADHSGAAYQASKRALGGLAHATNVEEHGHGVRVSVVAPGVTATDFGRHRRPEARSSPALREKALDPEDVGEVVAFLASLPPRAHIPELAVMPTLIGWAEGR